jgi:hypothetical protein
MIHRQQGDFISLLTKISEGYTERLAGMDIRTDRDGYTERHEGDFIKLLFFLK